MASSSAIKTGEGYISLGVDMSALTAGLKQAQAKLQAWGQGAMQAGRGLFDIGLQMAKMVQPGVMAFADYEQALADLQAASGLTGKNFDRVKEKIEEVSKSTGMMPVEVTQAFSELLKAGRTADEVIDGFGETVIKFARVSGIPMADAAVVIADALNLFSGDKGLNASVAANIINQAADATTLSLRDVTEAFRQGGSAMGQYNQTMFDTATAIAVASLGAQKGAQAGTQLKTLMTRLTTGMAAEAGEAGDEVEKAMAKIGLSVYGADGKVVPIMEIIRRIKEGLGGKTDHEQNAILKGLAGMKGMQFLLPLIKAGTKGFAEMQEKMAQSLSVEQKFAIMTDTLWGTMKKLWVHIQFVAIEIGAALAPALKSVGAILLPMLEGLQKWMKSHQDLVQTFALDAVKTMGYGLALMSLGIAFNTLAAILSPTGLLVGAFGFAIYMVITRIPGILDAFKDTWGGIVEAISAGDLNMAWQIVCLGMELVWTRMINQLKGAWVDFQYQIAANAVEVGNAMQFAQGVPIVGPSIAAFGKVGGNLFGTEREAAAASTAERDAANEREQVLMNKMQKLRNDAAWWNMVSDTIREAGFTPEGAPMPGRGQFPDANPEIPGHGSSVGTFSAAAISGMLGGAGPIDKLRGVAEEQLDVQKEQLVVMRGGMEWS